MINFRTEIISIQDTIINWRRDFHKNPELSFKEFRTGELIAKELRSMGLEPKTKVGKTGVTADLEFGSGPMIALRADMDALPIQETSGLPYSSNNDGIMHACGHDGHMAILLGAAEEGLGGAKYMIEDGCLNGVDEIYGLHLWNYQNLGEVGVKEGPVMAAADMFDIKITGIGGHGAAPQGTVDSIVVASHLVQSFQTIVSRNTNPLDSAVITIGQIKGGQNFNIIADKVHLSGTARTYTEENRRMLKERMNEIVLGTEKMYNAKIKFDYNDGYPPTVNHSVPAQRVLNAARKVVGDKAGPLYNSMAGEDFAYGQTKLPMLPPGHRRLCFFPK